MSDTTYNGWTNYETWNVALWIDNDEGLNSMAQDCVNYESFIETLAGLGETPISFQTPDGVAWNDSGINIDEINEGHFDEDE